MPTTAVNIELATPAARLRPSFMLALQLPRRGSRQKIVFGRVSAWTG